LVVQDTPCHRSWKRAESLLAPERELAASWPAPFPVSATHVDNNEDKRSEHKIQKARQEARPLWVVPLWFGTFLWPVASEGQVPMEGEGHPPALQLACCLPTGAGTKLLQVQVRCRQRAADAESADGRQTVPSLETWPLKSSKEICKEKQQGSYYSSWYTNKDYFLLFQLFLLDPCTGSVLLAELCFL